MRKLINIVSFIVLLTSCKGNEDQNTTRQSNKETIGGTKQQTVNEKKNINHLYVANGGSILYMKNGEKRAQAQFDTDGDFVTELLKVAKPNGTYKEDDTFLVADDDTIHFFEDYGKIAAEWRILKGNDIENDVQVVSYSSPKNINPNEVEVINSTSLLIFSPEPKNFEDENSKEADAYYTAMDDYVYYSSELSNDFKKFGVKTIYPKKRYIALEIESEKQIIIDTKSKVNNYNVSSLLYKKGTTPIIISLVMYDNNIATIKSYLK